MKKIDLKRFHLFTDITKERTVEVDARKTVANVLYTKFSGIVAHDLAFRIYKAEGGIEVNEEEAALLSQFGDQCTGVFRDSLSAALVSADEAETASVAGDTEQQGEAATAPNAN